jgi:hypothetical protein
LACRNLVFAIFFAFFKIITAKDFNLLNFQVESEAFTKITEAPENESDSSKKALGQRLRTF